MRSRSTLRGGAAAQLGVLEASSRVSAIARQSPIKSPIASPPMAASATYSQTPAVIAAARRAHGAGEIVDVDVAVEPVSARRRVVVQPRERRDVEARLAAPRRELGRPDQLRVLVRAARQQAEHVLGADDREREALEVAVDRREERRAAGPQRRGARRDDRCGLRHVLEHLEARDGIERAGRVRGELLDGDAAVVDRQAARGGVLLRRFDVLGRHVDRDDARAARRQALGQQAAAAADVEHARARKLARAPRCSRGAAC